MKKTYILVVPVWGEEHVKLWSQYCLPSYFSENNIPFLSQRAQLTFLICTDKSTKKILEEQQDFLGNLKKFCTLLFLDISPLIKKYQASYGHILTFSYHAAIKQYMSFYEGQSYFIFLNSDFILANGAFKTVYNLVKDGSDMIFCPSFRVLREEFLPTLENYFTDSQNSRILSVAPRKMVALALKHRHPSVVAQTLGEGIEGSLVTNQLYWKVGNETLLGRHFLTFPLAIKPSKIPKAPTGFIDYNVVYDFAPKGKRKYITDSDDAFIVEVESFYKESSHIALNEKSPRIYSEMIGKWANKLHFENFQELTVFHKGRLNDELEEEKRKFNIFCEALLSFCKEFKPFPKHPYWGPFSKPAYSKIFFYLKKILRKKVESSCRINLNDISFLISSKNNTVNFERNPLEMRALPISLKIFPPTSKVYVEVTDKFDYDQLETFSNNEERQIYIFGMNGVRKRDSRKFSKFHKKFTYIQSPEAHKILLMSIMFLNCERKYRWRGLIKTLFIRSYVRFFNPFPSFEIFQLL